MNKVIVNLSEHSYPICNGVKLGGLGAHLKTQKLSGSLKDAGFNVNFAIIPDGEKYKE